MGADEKAIRQLVETWMSASRSGEIKTVLGLMAEDVIFMVPGKEPFGKAAFVAGSQAMKDVRIDGTSDIQEVQVVGEWAWMRNRLEVTMTMPDGTFNQRSGFTLTVLRKQPNGAWVIYRDANLLAPK